MFVRMSDGSFRNGYTFKLLRESFTISAMF